MHRKRSFAQPPISSYCIKEISFYGKRDVPGGILHYSSTKSPLIPASRTCQWDQAHVDKLPILLISLYSPHLLAQLDSFIH